MRDCGRSCLLSELVVKIMYTLLKFLSLVASYWDIMDIFLGFEGKSSLNRTPCNLSCEGCFSANTCVVSQTVGFVGPLVCYNFVHWMIYNPGLIVKIGNSTIPNALSYFIFLIIYVLESWLYTKTSVLINISVHYLFWPYYRHFEWMPC